MADTGDERNRRIYHARGIASHYRQQTLSRAEAIALLKHASAFVGHDVLDLGVGTGRTAIYLAPLARRYEAIDYSPRMVEAMRARMPECSVRIGDMRDLAGFADASFDFVLGACNVIDAVNHEDRMRTFAEVARVLRRDGLFMFSSHNLDFAHALAAPRPEFSRNPATMAANLVHWLRQLVNHLRMKPLREVHAEHALLDDGGHDNALLHYYSRQRHVRAQLDAAGLDTLEALDANGRVLGADDSASAFPYLLYVARRR